MKYYDDKQIQWLRASCTSDVNYTTQASIHPSTDTRKPAAARVPVITTAIQMHTVVHTPRLGTYSWLRAASCPPLTIPVWQLAQPMQPCMQQENYCQVSNTMSAKNYLPWQQLICKVQSALNAAVDLSGEERVDLQIIREAAMEF